MSSKPKLSAAKPPLTEAIIRDAAPRERPYKVADGEGLYVLVTPAGGKLWRFNFTFNGKQKTLALGKWPGVSLREARQRRSRAQAALSEGRDPASEKQQRKRAAKRKQAPTFEQAARAWHAKQLNRWTDDYARQVLIRLESDVFPSLGRRRFEEIERSDVLTTLRAVEDRGVLETARRLRQYIGQIYRFAAVNDDSIVDPTPMLKGALKAPPKPKHHKRLAFDLMGDFLRKLAKYDTDFQGEPETRLAIKLTIFTAARTSETIGAQWVEFSDWKSDRTSALWRVPAERMKMDDPHMVPLSTQAVEVLRELHAITGARRFLFPQPFGRDRPMSNNAMLFALYRMGYRGRATMHGFRAVFSTWANEHGFNSDVVELCLAHDERDRVRGAYNAAKRLDERRALLQAWADALDEAEMMALV